MPKLNEYGDSDWNGGGGDYLPAGEYDVTVDDVRLFECNSGSPGVEYDLTCSAHPGKHTRVSFIFKPGSDVNFKRFSGWLAALGLSRDERHEFDTDSQVDHEGLLGMVVHVRVAENSKGFHEVVAWSKLSGVTGTSSVAAVDDNIADDENPF